MSTDVTDRQANDKSARQNTTTNILPSETLQQLMCFMPILQFGRHGHFGKQFTSWLIAGITRMHFAKLPTYASPAAFLCMLRLHRRSNLHATCKPGGFLHQRGW
jgi:hypothetical protein